MQQIHLKRTRTLQFPIQAEEPYGSTTEGHCLLGDFTLPPSKHPLTRETAVKNEATSVCSVLMVQLLEATQNEL